MTINEKIVLLRIEMTKHNFGAYIIPGSDPHQSEYVSDFWKSREWVSGFTGSAGLVIVLQNQAGLWTDSRYFLQAETQLKGSCIELKKQGVAHAPEHVEWLKSVLPKGSKIGLDGKLFSIGQVQKLTKSFRKSNIHLVTNIDLISSIRHDRSIEEEKPIFDHDTIYSGLTRVEKLNKIRVQMMRLEADNYLISTLDDIAWAFNLRGSDVACNPVFYAYAIIRKDVAHLFVKKSKISTSLSEKLSADGVLLYDYSLLESFLKKLDGNILIDLTSTSNQVYNSIAKEKIKHERNIVRELKAIKNETEIGHIKNAMLKDGVALTKLFRWLESTLDNRAIPETEVAKKLISFRAAQEGYYGESFDAIVGYNGNGAIVHYRAEPETCANIKKEGILLLDSGGQYFNGTTDITRTIALGKPTVEQMHNFTLVLKGHIALDSAKFPHGTTGPQLDMLARMYLWQEGLNYGHGTGHGVGFFLNVHEPPQGFTINSPSSRAQTAIMPGMFTSNEPGFYKKNEYGIRIENLVLCKEAEKTDFGQFYQLENLTLFPIDINLIEKELLTTKEINWLNNYHENVLAKLTPLLNEDETEWMKEKCCTI